MTAKHRSRQPKRQRRSEASRLTDIARDIHWLRCHLPQAMVKTARDVARVEIEAQRESWP